MVSQYSNYDGLSLVNYDRKTLNENYLNSSTFPLRNKQKDILHVMSPSCLYGDKVVNKMNRQIRRSIVNTLRPSQDGRYFAADIFKCIFMNEHVRISIEISLKFAPKGSISKIPAQVSIMVCRRPGDKPLSEPMMVRLSLTHWGQDKMAAISQLTFSHVFSWMNM